MMPPWPPGLWPWSASVFGSAALALASALGVIGTAGCGSGATLLQPAMVMVIRAAVDRTRARADQRIERVMGNPPGTIAGPSWPRGNAERNGTGRPVTARLGNENNE